MSVAYDLPPRVRRVRPQAPAVVLPFPRPVSAPATDSVDAVEVASAGRRDGVFDPAAIVATPSEQGPVAPEAVRAFVDLVRAPADGFGGGVATDGSRERVDDSRRVGPRGPVECPSSSPTRSRAAREAAPAGYRNGRVRLTARGRRLRALLCAAALLVAGWITVSAIHSAVSSPVIPPSAPAVVQVHQGDSLWSIAARVAPRQDPRRVVDALRSANHLQSNTVHPGQQLHVPH